MKKIIDITGYNLCIFEFDKNKEIRCADTLVLDGKIYSYDNQEIFRKDNFIVTKSYDISFPGSPQLYYYSFSKGIEFMQFNLNHRLPSRYFKNIPFIQGIFELKMKHFIKDPITEKTIHYPEIKIQGKNIPIAEHMKDFIFRDDLYDFHKVKQYRTFDEIEFEVYDISNSLFFHLKPLEK